MDIECNEKKFTVTIGGDAEFFLQKDGELYPASKVIPGSKEEPFELENGVCHPDGLSLEVGFPPAKTPNEFFANILKVIQEVRVKFLEPNGVKFHSDSEVKVTDIEATDKDLERGCSSEYFAWMNQGESIKQVEKSADEYRFSGFHIHLGFTEGQKGTPLEVQDMAVLARVMDGFVMKHKLNTTDLRSQQYGGYGAFRCKPYGIEYRAMDSSVFLQRHKVRKLMSFLNDIPKMFRGAQRHGKSQTYYGINCTSHTAPLKRTIRDNYRRYSDVS